MNEIDIKWQPTKELKATALRKYCELDTWAMVKLHQYIQKQLKFD